MELNESIKQFYDQSTPLWLNVWGEHMHHGYYHPGQVSTKDHHLAQIQLVEEMLRWGKVDRATAVFDAGCGVGGSSRMLARRFDAQVWGVTISPLQAEKGRQFNKAAGLENSVKIEAADLTTMKRSEQKFDLIWSIESMEHIAGKKGVIDLFYELLTPGGRLLISTWCHRTEPPELIPTEKKLLQKVENLYHLPPLVSIENLQNTMLQAGFTKVASDDWSEAVAPFRAAVIKSGFRPGSVLGLLRAGWPTIKAAWAIRYMIAGYRQKVIRYGVFQGTKTR